MDDSTKPAPSRAAALRHFTKRHVVGLRHRENAYFVVLAILLLVVFPTCLDAFRLNLWGKYLTYAFVSLGLVLTWGYSGILSLGQGVFFGLGGYCMAMFLKLEASDAASTSIQSTPGIPDFMDWNQITALPLFWIPFKSLAFTLVAVVVVPGILAFVIGTAMFKRRVGGVYFAIITQAVAAILSILIIGRQGLYGRRQRHHRPQDAPRLGHPDRLGEADPLLRQRGPPPWRRRAQLLARPEQAR